MTAPGSLILVHLVEKLPEDATFKLSRASWPLHITLLPWFTVKSEDMLSQALERYGRTLEPFQVAVGAVALFGDSSDIPVNVIEDQLKLKKLHAELLQLVESSGGSLKTSHWTEDEYRAHITVHESAVLTCIEGDTLNITDMHIVRLLDDSTCQVAKRIIFGTQA